MVIIKDLQSRAVVCGGILEDCKRLQKILSQRYIVSIPEVYLLWLKFSESIACSWCRLYTNDEHTFNCLIEALDNDN